MMRSLRLGVLLLGLLSLPADSRAAWRSEGPYQAVVVDVAVDPQKPDTLYAATSAGGVWRSDDGGQNWTLPGDELVSRGIRWIEVDPGDPATVWAGLDITGASALWRSPDRGKSWAPVRVDPTSYAVGQPIAFAASDPRIVFVPSSNLHYRRTDGKSWVSFRVPGQDVYAFAVHPRNPLLVYAGGRGAEHNMSRSQDGGKTWTPFGKGLGKDNSIRRLRIAPGSPSTLYAISGVFGRVHKSDDGGASWTELDLGLRGTDELYDFEVDPRNHQVLLAATKQGLRRSADGGSNWSTVGAGTGGYLCKGVAFHPTRNDVVYAGVAGTGVYKSDDAAESFEPLGKGLAAGWVEKLYAPSASAGPVFAQLSVGLFRQDGPGAWTELQAPFAPGDTVKIDGIMFDRSSPKKIYAHDGSSWWRSDDAGKGWSKLDVPQPGLRAMMKGKMSHPEFKSLVQDSGDPKIFYSGCWSSMDPGMCVYKTINSGKKWEPAGTGITSKSVTLLRAGAPGTLFAVGGDDGVFKTADGGKSWSLVRPGKLKDLAVSPTKPELVFAATEKGLFRSTDTGATWARVTQGLKGDDVEAVVVSAKDGQIFAGTFHGVFKSADDGSTWTAMNEGLGSKDVRALAIAGGSAPRLYAGLAGGSVYSTELP